MRTTKERRVVGLVGVVAATVVGCGTTADGTSLCSEPRSVTVAGAELTGPDAEAFERWTGAGVDDYRFTVTALCECNGGSYLVTVRDDEVVAVRPADDRWQPAAVATIPDLFALISDERRTSFEVVVEYDAELGYPTRIFADRIENAIDDEVTYRITAFEPLTP